MHVHLHLQGAGLRLGDVEGRRRHSAAGQLDVPPQRTTRALTDARDDHPDLDVRRGRFPQPHGTERRQPLRRAGPPHDGAHAVAMSGRRLRPLAMNGAALGATALLLGACNGLGATGGCPVIGDCGGNPVGVWQVEPALSCSFPVYSRPAQDYATPPYFEPETGATPPATTSGNWCWDLTFDMMGNVATPSIPMANTDVIVGGTITFSADHSYVYSLTATSTTKFNVAKSCFGVNGAGTTCAELAVKLENSAIGANPSYMNLSAGATPAFRCTDGGDECDCEFDYVEAEQFADAVGDMGQ